MYAKTTSLVETGLESMSVNAGTGFGNVDVAAETAAVLPRCDTATPNVAPIGKTVKHVTIHRSGPWRSGVTLSYCGFDSRHIRPKQLTIFSDTQFIYAVGSMETSGSALGPG